MSDVAQGSPNAGSISPRNIDTRAFRVLRELPDRMAAIPVGAVFTSWPQGEILAHVSGVGIGGCTNQQIEDWLKAEWIALVPAQTAPEKPKKGGLGARKGAAAS